MLQVFGRNGGEFIIRVGMTFAFFHWACNNIQRAGRGSSIFDGECQEYQ